MGALQLAAVDASNRYRSPRNPERKIRKTTELIVLHTTEAPARSSLNKVSERGECHFCVTEEGTIYRIVDRDREAFHAGRSMWKGREDVDKFSIGIECVGYHDKQMSLIQLYAIRDLVKELKSMYHLTDDKVVCHSHVAYGTPNKWQKRRHRGRKRCGMLFAMPTIRKILELKARPAVDADTKAKRLVVGDPYLEKVLYGNVDTMRNAYAGVKTSKPASGQSEGGLFSWLKTSTAETVSAAVAPAKEKPAAPKPQPKPQPKPVAATPPKPQTAPKPATPPKPAAMAQKPAPKPAATPQAVAERQTVPVTVDYLPVVTKPAGAYGTPRNEAELKELGFKLKGSVSRAMTASAIAGRHWNSADTYYTIRNKVIPGNQIDAKHIEVGMNIWMKN